MANSLRMKELGDIWESQKIFGVLQNAAANRLGDLFFCGGQSITDCLLRVYRKIREGRQSVRCSLRRTSCFATDVVIGNLEARWEFYQAPVFAIKTLTEVPTKTPYYAYD